MSRKTDASNVSEPASPTPSETSSHGEDLAKLMEAIANSEKTVLARIDTMEKKTDLKYQELHQNIESLSTDVKGSITAVRDEVMAEISSIQLTCNAQEARLTSLEEANNVYSDRVVDLETQVSQLKNEVSNLNQKVEDIEGRQRRDNIRILGVKEVFVLGPRPTQSVAKLLQDCLQLEAMPTLDRAHRSLLPEPGKGNVRQKPTAKQWPRAIIVKFHYHQEKVEVMRKAAAMTSLEFEGEKIMIFPDLPQAVAKRRAAFKDTKELLRNYPDVRFGMVYPAKLRITSALGEKVFSSPVAAKNYVLTNFSQAQENVTVE